MSTQTNIVNHAKPIGYLKGFMVAMIAVLRILKDWIHGNTPCHRINAYVKAHAKKGDVGAVLRAADAYCRDEEWVMLLGKYKAERFSKIVKDCHPTSCLEVGTFCGYSAILLGSLIPDGGHVYTIEYDRDMIDPAKELIEYAGLSHKVTVLRGDAGDVISSNMLRDVHKVGTFDFVLLDHHKPLYYRELKHLEKGNYLKKGSVIVGDDLGWPSSPEYDEYIQRSDQYESEFFDTKISMFDIQDVMAKSVYKGD